MQRDSGQVTKSGRKPICSIRMSTGELISFATEYSLVTDLWIDFLNAAPWESWSMWNVYDKYRQGMDDLRYCLDKEGHSYSKDLKDIPVFSRQEFLDQYLSKATIIEEIQYEMRKLVEFDSTAEEVGAMVQRLGVQFDIPSVVFRVCAERIGLLGTRVDFCSQPQLEIDAPYGDHPYFWVSLVLVGMVSSYNAGKLARRCLAEDCRRYYIVAYRSHMQKYHSKTCQKRAYMREYRKKLLRAELGFEDSMP